MACSSCINQAISAAAGTVGASMEACAAILQYFNVVLFDWAISLAHSQAAS